MATARPGPGLEGVQGRSGSTVYLRSIVNTRVLQARRQAASATPGQLISRANLAAAVVAWRALSQAQRDAWDQYAVDLGDLLDPPAVIRQSGYNLFVAQKALALRNGFAAAAVPSGFADGRAASQSLLFDVISSGAQLRGRFLRDTVDGDFTNARASVYVTPPQPPSRRAFRDAFTFIGSYAYDASGAPVSGYPVTFNLPRVVQPGQVFWARVRTVTDAGTYGARIDWLVQTVPPGWRLAWRMRPFLAGGEGVSAERTPANELIITENTPDPLLQSTFNLVAPATDTIGELRSAILSTTFFEFFDYDATLAARPATDIPAFPVTSIPYSAQPMQVIVPA